MTDGRSFGCEGERESLRNARRKNLLALRSRPQRERALEITPRSTLGTRARGGVVRVKGAVYSDEALIPVFRFRGNAAATQRPARGGQDLSCRNPFVLTKNS